MLEILARGKRSSFLPKLSNYDRKSFVGLDPGYMPAHFARTKQISKTAEVSQT